ncbi:MAG: UDP-2,4-diacetamido-2,4,6-trideoxy-beta-L-altropyranose hydrolase [Deltaproteobacteria bacterium]|nr:UDP-2,4-diacetamido-2,4,6-trideoxy-beta-L-altropyranose hydrolase [Deltaproteobacteria bacterium]
MSSACIRADASLRIGSGHIGRCLALADALRARGIEVVFACRPLAGHGGEAVRRRGHTVAWVTAAGVVGGSPDPDPVIDQEPFFWEHDLDALRAWLGRRAPFDWLIVDHYGIDARWESPLQASARSLVVVDDLADRRHDCDLLLDQNVLGGGDPYEALVPGACRRLLGPRYALLRTQFRDARGSPRPRDGGTGRLLVSFGGHDAAGATELALGALDDLEWPVPRVDIVVGGPSQRRAAIAGRCAARRGATCLGDVEDMAALMAAADLALGAGGITTWERCCLGLPAIVTSVAPNQRGVVAAAADAGFVVDVGPVEEVRPAALAAALAALLRDAPRAKALREAAGRVCDGLGAWRVGEALVAGAAGGSGVLWLRRADAADLLLYHEWANDPDVRANSFSSDPIPLETHRRWFQRRLADPACFLYLLEEGGQAAAQIRFDLVAGGARVSFSVDRARRGHGLAAEVLRRGARRLAGDAPHGRLAFGLVKRGNGASLRAFRAAGYHESRELGEQRDDSTTFVLGLEEA